VCDFCGDAFPPFLSFPPPLSGQRNVDLLRMLPGATRNLYHPIFQILFNYDLLSFFGYIHLVFGLCSQCSWTLPSYLTWLFGRAAGVRISKVFFVVILATGLSFIISSISTFLPLVGSFFPLFQFSPITVPPILKPRVLDRAIVKFSNAPERFVPAKTVPVLLQSPLFIPLFYPAGPPFFHSQFRNGAFAPFLFFFFRGFFFPPPLMIREQRDSH